MSELLIDNSVVGLKVERQIVADTNILRLATVSNEISQKRVLEDVWEIRLGTRRK
jgi:hypothetical protein